MAKPQLQVMTANRLSDGVVVYLDAQDRWVEVLGDALVAKTKTAVDALLAGAELAVGARRVVGPYLFAVAATATGIDPISQREHIRSLGPTVGTDFPEARDGA